MFLHSMEAYYQVKHKKMTKSKIWAKMEHFGKKIGNAIFSLNMEIFLHICQNITCKNSKFSYFFSIFLIVVPLFSLAVHNRQQFYVK